jgi:hypothetical protein
MACAVRVSGQHQGRVGVGLPFATLGHPRRGRVREAQDGQTSVARGAVVERWAYRRVLLLSEPRQLP